MTSKTADTAARAGQSMVMIYSQVPEDAMTAGFLGTARTGQGVCIDPEGLIVTVGYLVIEAEQIWLTSRDGRGAPAYVIAQDYESGLALLKSSMPIGSSFLPPGSSAGLEPGDTVQITSYDHNGLLPHNLAVRQEFCGRWEYLLDDALFTTPVIENWAGIGLLNHAGEVCGIGSLMLEVPVTAFETTPGNMFIPLETIIPCLDELYRQGRRSKAPRPWLGTMIQEYEGKLILVAVYKDGPAHQAGLEPGDIIVSIGDEPVTSLPEMLHNVWSLGSAGIDVPLTFIRSGKVFQFRLRSIDRAAYHKPPTADMLN